MNGVFIDRREGVSGVVDMGVKMTIARLGTSLTMDLMRVLEGTRQRISDDSAASAVAGAPQCSFLFCFLLLCLYVWT
jgi:hypothetical protein